MDGRLYDLIEKARGVTMTPAERETQRLGFAYGNTRIENAEITRNTVREAAERLSRSHDAR